MDKKDKKDKNLNTIKILEENIEVNRIIKDCIYDDFKEAEQLKKDNMKSALLALASIPVIDIGIFSLANYTAPVLIFFTVIYNLGASCVILFNTSKKKKLEYKNIINQLNVSLEDINKSIEDKELEIDLRKILDLSYNSYNLNEEQVNTLKESINNNVLENMNLDEINELDSIVYDERLKQKQKELLSKELIMKYKKGMKESYIELKQSLELELETARLERDDKIEIFEQSVNECDSIEELYKAKEVLEQREKGKQKIKR